MAKITKAYMRTRDIDWFCSVNGKPAHFASFCGLLPNAINNRERLMRMQRFVNDLPDLPYPIGINHAFVRQRFGNEAAREDTLMQYISAFEKFARKGFMSFDKYDLSNPNDNRYVLVAWAILPKEFDINIEFPLKMEIPEIDLRNINELTIVDVTDYIN